MKSALPKVLHPLLGRTLVGHVLAAAAPRRRRAHAGRGRPRRRPGDRPPRRGRAGRRPRCSRPSSTAPGTPSASRWTPPPTPRGTVVVLNGDVPLLRAETLAALVERARGDRRRGHRARRRGGRPDRARPHRPRPRTVGSSGSSRSATPPTRSGRSGRSTPGIYAFDAVALRAALGKLSTDNDQGEEYLTDVFALLGDAGERVAVHLAARRRPRRSAATTGRSWPALRALLRDRVNARLDALRRDDPRPGDHLDRRHRDARAATR